MRDSLSRICICSINSDTCINSNKDEVMKVITGALILFVIIRILATLAAGAL